MKKALQYYSEERLKADSKLSPSQIANFLEDFRLMYSENIKEMTAISVRIDRFLLESFKGKCASKGLNSYQKQIRLLMTKWLQEE